MGKKSEAQPKNREVKNRVGATKERSYVMNSPATIEQLKNHFGGRKGNIDQGLSAGKAGTHKVDLIGKGEKFHLTSSSADSFASGNYLSKEHPGATSKERRENLQLPPKNAGGNVSTVESKKAQVGIKSTVAPAPEEWANKGGYKARDGIQQTFTPNRNRSGAIADGRYEVVKGHTAKKMNNSTSQGNTSLAMYDATNKNGGSSDMFNSKKGNAQGSQKSNQAKANSFSQASKGSSPKSSMDKAQSFRNSKKVDISQKQQTANAKKFSQSSGSSQSGSPSKGQLERTKASQTKAKGGRER